MRRSHPELNDFQQKPPFRREPFFQQKNARKLAGLSIFEPFYHELVLIDMLDLMTCLFYFIQPF